ncbi:MAG: HD-GYP domain-containing protein [Planctomycetota bacterium]
MAESSLMQVEDRASLLRRVAVLLVEESLAEPHTPSAVEETVRLSHAMARFVIDEPDAMAAFRRLLAGGKSRSSHSVNVSMLSLGMAQAMGFSSQNHLMLVVLAGFLHDIGYPSNARYRERKTNNPGHCIRGGRILEEMRLPPEIVKVAQQHHERADCSGYPARLGRSEIHPLAMIVGFADVFEDMRCANGGRLGVHDCLRIMNSVYRSCFQQEAYDGFVRFLEST